MRFIIIIFSTSYSFIAYMANTVYLHSQLYIAHCKLTINVDSYIKNGLC